LRWTALILIAANLAIAAYLALIDRPSGTESDTKRLELNADKIKTLKSTAAPKPPAVK
jgi:hypothetical protein